MNIDFTGRQVEITPALRKFTEEKLSKLERLLDGPLDIHVVLAIEKHRHLAEVQVKSRNAIFSGAQETGDLYASVGEVADKLERQALKHKEKLRHHKVRKGPRDPEVAATLAAAAAPEGDLSPAAVEEDRPASAVRRVRSYRAKPLSAEDAVLELEESGDELLVYRDAQTDRFCVLHRAKDGHLHLVEPDF